MFFGVRRFFAYAQNDNYDRGSTTVTGDRTSEKITAWIAAAWKWLIIRASGIRMIQTPSIFVGSGFWRFVKH